MSGVLYSGKEIDAVYLGKQAAEGSEAGKRIAQLQYQVKAVIQSDPKISELTKEIQISRGQQVYMQTCFVCHQPNGLGLTGQIPPLAKSDFLMADKERSIRAVLQGLSGEITVNGKPFNAQMIPLNTLTDEEVANVITYVRNSWGNSGEAATVGEVRRIRSEAPAPVNPAVGLE